MAFENLIPFIITCVLIELTPGPNMTYLALVSSMRGRRAGLWIVAGVACGLLAIGIVALGSASLFLQNEGVYEALRWGGVLYLLWLAYDVWRQQEEENDAGDHWRKYFIRGFITNLLNPKAALFYITVFPAYVTREGSVWAHFLAMIGIYIAVASIIHSLIAVFGGKLQPYFVDERRARYSRMFFSAALIGVAAWMGISTGR